MTYRTSTILTAWATLIAAGCAPCLHSPDSCAVWLDAGPPLLCDRVLCGLTGCTHAHGDLLLSEQPFAGNELALDDPMTDGLPALAGPVRRVQQIEADRPSAAKERSIESAQPESLPAPHSAGSRLRAPGQSSAGQGSTSFSAQRSAIERAAVSTAHTHGCECGACVEPCVACPLGELGHLQNCPLLKQPPLGPSPVRCQPPMPPKLLPVPVRPVHSRVPLDAPVFRRGYVEVGYESELRIQSRD